MRKVCAILVLLGAMFECTAAAQPPQPVFADRRDYYAPSQAVAVGDVNHDGIPDLVSGYAGLTVQFGNGDGTFRPGLSRSTPWIVFSLKLIDLNRDGNLDALFATSQPGIAVCYGNGDGTFQPAVSYATGQLEDNTKMAVGDFNGDHLPDVATPGANGVWLFFGTPGGGFSAGTLVPLGFIGDGRPMGAADLNGDGKLDLVVGANPGVLVLPGNGDGTFGAPQPYSTASPVDTFVLGDFNRDGHIDLAASGENSIYASILLGKGDGTFNNPTTMYLPGGFSIVAGDVNGDGIPDLVTQSVFIAFGKGDGTFQPAVYHPVGSRVTEAGETAYQVVLADLRRIGRLDIVTATVQGNLSVLLNNGRGGFSDGEYLKTGGSPGCDAVADFNGDGKPDLVFSNGQGATVLLGTGKAVPAYSLPGIQLSVAGGYCVAVGDFNHDGLPDVVVSASPTLLTGSLAVFLGRGDGTFVSAGTLSLNTPAGVPVVADFNHYGRQDVAVGAGLLAFGNGDGTLQTPVPFVPQPAPGAYYTDLATADLNGDGYPDIVLVDGHFSTIYVLLNQGNGTFRQSTFQDGVPCGSPFIPSLADLNGDGKPDLTIFCNSLGISIYLGNGDGTFRQAPTIAAPYFLAGGGVLVGDLNGDGKPDLAVAANQSVYLFTGNGDGTFNTPVLFGAGLSPTSMVASHLHPRPAAVGKPDLSISDSAFGSILVLVNITP